MLPKVETADQLQTADWVMAQLEREHGLEVGSIDLLPIIETGLGLHNIEAITMAGRACVGSHSVPAILPAT